jgi:NADH-quinone oxidoreductase subunit I
VKEVPNLPTHDRSGLWLSLDELLTWNPQSDVAKPYPPGPVRKPAQRAS